MSKENKGRALGKNLREFAIWHTKEELEAFLKATLHHHLSCQQKVGKLIFTLIKALNDYPHQDSRNAQAKKFATLVIKATGEDFDFPLI